MPINWLEWSRTQSNEELIAITRGDAQGDPHAALTVLGERGVTIPALPKYWVGEGMPAGYQALPGVPTTVEEAMAREVAPGELIPGEISLGVFRAEREVEPEPELAPIDIIGNEEYLLGGIGIMPNGDKTGIDWTQLIKLGALGMAALPGWAKVLGGAAITAGTLGWLGGGNNQVINNIPLGGPGLAEPPAQQVVKEWETQGAQFYLLTDGRIAVYGKKSKRWRVYRPQKHIVVPRNPRLGTLLRATKRIDRMWVGIRKKTRKIK